MSDSLDTIDNNSDNEHFQDVLTQLEEQARAEENDLDAEVA